MVHRLSRYGDKKLQVQDSNSAAISVIGILGLVCHTIDMNVLFRQHMQLEFGSPLLQEC